MPTDGPRARRPTLLDVAAAAGVSRATASLVLRDTGHLADSTRERVRAAMADLGYVYHRGAASLRVGSSRTVGLIVPASSNLFMGEFTAAFELDLQSRDLVTLVCHSYEDVERQALLIRSLQERGVDAMVVVPAIDSARFLEPILAGLDVPVVLASRPVRSLAVDFVGPDNVLGARLAMRHLLAEHAVSTLAYVGGSARLEVRDDRLRGIGEEIEAAGAATRVVADIPSALSGSAGSAAMRELASRGPLPDAIVCHSETIAFGLYRVLRDEFPDRVDAVSVICFDDVEEAALWEPPLTTIAANASALGAAAAAMLMEPARDGRPRFQTITPRLVVRRSCGCHPARESSVAPSG